MIFWDAILEAFGFELGEKAFHRRVIVAAAFAAHTRGDMVDFKCVAEVLGSALNAAIGTTWVGT